MKSTVEILGEARALIEDPEHWTQRAMARGRSGRDVHLRGRAAVAWCVMGACSRVGFGPPLSQACDLLVCATGESLTRFNDTSTHTEVLAALDKAIELAEAEK